MTTQIEVKGLQPLIARMQKYPKELQKVMEITTKAALLVFWENVPPYPEKTERGSYDRTGTLGRSLGVGEGGGKAGEPSIFTVKPIGTSGYEGKFGTNLGYAPYVIGDGTQAKVHQGRWWTMKTIAEKSAAKIAKVFNTAGEKLAAFLAGKE